ncbi:MAG TPA: YCF48-related protein [Anaerolineaceae bacterium]|nr:YCF48-related protein [Anaerolineaceae bacterium]
MKKLFVILIIFSLVSASCIILPAPAPTVIPPTAAVLSTSSMSPTASAAPSISPSATLEQTPAPSASPESTVTAPAPQASFAPLSPIAAGTPVTLTFLQMIDRTSGWGIESTGHIVRTTNGGRAWQDVTPPQGAYIHSGFFALDSDNAWASPKSWCGANIGDCQGADQTVNAAIVWHTTDGGQSWQSSQAFSLVTPSGSDPMAYWPHLFFIDSQTGWNITWVSASQNGQIFQELFKTSDGGATWQLQAGEAELQKSFTGGVGSFVFIDAQTGWAVENGSAGNPVRINKTTDGGQTWTVAPIPNIDQLSGASSSSCSVAPAYQATSTSGIGVACSAGGGVNFFDLSLDSGQTWLTWQDSIGESFYNAQTGWRLTTTASNSQNQLQQTSDGGKTWQTLKVVSWQNSQFDFVDQQNGMAIVTIGAASALLSTADGGKTWQEIKPVAAATIAAARLNLNNIKIYTEKSGWATAYIPDGNTFLLHTTDGGQTWQDVTPDIVANVPFSTSFLDENTAWVYSQNSNTGQTSGANLLRTTDGGSTWKVITHSLPQDFLFGSPWMTFLNLKEGWTETYGAGAGQAHIQMFATHDGGVSWSQVMLVNPDSSPGSQPGTLDLCNICEDNFYYDPIRQFITYGDMASDPVGKVRASIAFDQGKTWKELELPFPSAKFADALVAPQDPVFFNKNEGVLPVRLVKFNTDGSNAYNVLALYTTQDGGLSWTPDPVVVENVSSQSDIHFVSPQDAFVACDVDLCATNDGAQTWQALHANLNFNSSGASQKYVWQYEFTSTAIGWAISTDGNTYSLWQTQDGGHTWEEMHPTVITK